jgi:hypothetical protein
MTYIKQIIAALTITFSLMTPAFASACGTVSADSAVFSTPVSMKGHFIFVSRISRRALLKAVAERQQTSRQVLFRGTI